MVDRVSLSVLPHAVIPRTPLPHLQTALAQPEPAMHHHRHSQTDTDMFLVYFSDFYQNNLLILFSPSRHTKLVRKDTINGYITLVYVPALGTNKPMLF